MGLRRMIWRSTGIGRTIDTIKNIVDEGNFVDGIKRTIKEDVCEDNPIGKAIYDIGKYEGKKSGYVKASDEYKEKLLKQADLFLKEQKIYEAEREQYEALMNEYEVEIERLESTVTKTEAEKEYLQELLLRDRKLRKLISV